MANLHKTERKLLWWVRDGGLHSDWPQGGGWGKFFAVMVPNLHGMPDTATHCGREIYKKLGFKKRRINIYI